MIGIKLVKDKVLSIKTKHYNKQSGQNWIVISWKKNQTDKALLQ